MKNSITTEVSRRFTDVACPAPFSKVDSSRRMSWRTFKFFEFEELKDPDSHQAYDKLKVGNENSTSINFAVFILNNTPLNLCRTLV